MKKRGNSLVEVVIGAAILSTVALAFLGTLSALSNFHQRNMLSIKGSLLAEEGIEALRSIKGAGWSNLSSLLAGQIHFLELAPASGWITTAEPEIVDGLFYRSFILSAVSRNAVDAIVSSGGSTDPDTLLATVHVAWKWRGATSTVTYKTYVTSI